MSRYNGMSTFRDAKNVTRRATTILPVIPITSADTYIETTSLERLDKLAYVFYDDPGLWWVIASANGLGKGSLIVPSNTKLRIPSNSRIQDILIDINRTR